jgi:hypothetical protein
MKNESIEILTKKRKEFIRLKNRLMKVMGWHDDWQFQYEEKSGDGFSFLEFRCFREGK